MRLYSYWKSSSAWRVRIALHLKQLQHQVIAVDLQQGQQQDSSFLELNSRGQVPVLEVEQNGATHRLAQSMAILMYLEQVAPAPRLLPDDPIERAFVLQAAELINAGIQPLQNGAVTAFTNTQGGDGLALARHFVVKGLRSLEGLTRERGGLYSVGDELSLADVLLVPQLYAARRLDIELSEFTTLLSIEQRCASLPAFQAAHPDAQSDKPASEAASTNEPKPRLERLLGVHYYVKDLDRSRRFYVDVMDFQSLGGSSPELEQQGRQRSEIFRAGDCTVVCSTPIGDGGRASRYLRKHPDGIGTIVFEVQNIQGWFAQLEAAGATPITDVQTHRDQDGTLATFSITTPFGDTTFRFIEQRGYRGFFPGMQLHATPQGGSNRFAFSHIDHITSNFQTMSPALLWLEHVMGFERFWGVEFHTRDVAVQTFDDGSGLRSAVMREPHTSIKFANNEPYRPFFKRSQINLFNEDHRGDGVQHIALATADIIHTVGGLLERGARFMSTPGSYYDALPRRLEELGVGKLDEDLQALRELGILVDGEGPGRYLLQIFLQDSAGLYSNPEAGPFFYEIIQRKGDRGFGAGNFRALFESIEREQMVAAKTET